MPKKLPPQWQKLFCRRRDWEKKKVLLSSEDGPQEVRDKLLHAFPKLGDGGGFEYIKGNALNKSLEQIPYPFGGFGAQQLKSICGSARVYLRPVQQSLSLERVDTPATDVNELQEKCLHCHALIPQTNLRKHVESCQTEGSSNSRSSTVPTCTSTSPINATAPVAPHVPNTSQSNLPVVPTVAQASRPTAVLSSVPSRQTPTTEHCPDLNVSFALTPATPEMTGHYRSYVEECVTLSSNDEEEDDAQLNAAILESLQTAGAEGGSDVPLIKILGDLASVIDREDSFRLNINRAAVWDCAVRGFNRASFSPCKRLSIHFTDSVGTMEGAVDEGGPRREFLRLLSRALQSSMVFDGPQGQRVLSMNSVAMTRKLYYTAGVMIAVILVHGGPLTNFFSPTFYAIITQGFDKANPRLEDVSDHEERSKIEAIMNAESPEEWEVALEDASFLINAAGCYGHQQDSRDKLVSGLLRFWIIDRCRSAYESFLEGLGSLGVLKAIQKHPQTFRECFIYKKKCLNAERVEELFKYSYSEEGSNKKRDEERTVGFWLDLLLDIEDKTSKITFSEIMIFSTCAEDEPPAGFDVNPSLDFLHSPLPGTTERSRLPLANTCGCVLMLPIHATYSEFKERMEFGIQGAEGFGFA